MYELVPYLYTSQPLTGNSVLMKTPVLSSLNKTTAFVLTWLPPVHSAPTREWERNNQSEKRFLQVLTNQRWPRDVGVASKSETQLHHFLHQIWGSDNNISEVHSLIVTQPSHVHSHGGQYTIQELCKMDTVLSSDFTDYVFYYQKCQTWDKIGFDIIRL